MGFVLIFNEFLILITVAPTVSLVFGSSNQNEQILEGSELYFECNVNANPRTQRIVWLFNGQPLRDSSEFNQTISHSKTIDEKLKNDLNNEINIENHSESDSLQSNKLIRTLPPTGIRLSANSLHIRSASRLHSGRYRCSAANILGESSSDEINVHVHFPPVCAQPLHKQHVLNTQSIEPETIVCNFSGDPVDLQVHWLWKPTFIGSGSTNTSWDTNTQFLNSNEVMNSDVSFETFVWPFQTNGSIVDGWQLLYTEKVKPTLSEDAGFATQVRPSSFPLLQSHFRFRPPPQVPMSILHCWANNSVGHQIVPCSIQVFSAQCPDPPGNCSVTNATKNALTLACKAGFSGGLRQQFHLEVYEQITHQSKAVISTPTVTDTGAQTSQSDRQLSSGNQTSPQNASAQTMTTIELSLEKIQNGRRLLFNISVVDEPLFLLNSLPPGKNRFVC